MISMQRDLHPGPAAACCRLRRVAAKGMPPAMVSAITRRVCAWCTARAFSPARASEAGIEAELEGTWGLAHGQQCVVGFTDEACDGAGRAISPQRSPFAI